MFEASIVAIMAFLVWLAIDGAAIIPIGRGRSVKTIRRREFKFSLRTLLIVVTLAALVLTVWHYVESLK